VYDFWQVKYNIVSVPEYFEIKGYRRMELHATINNWHEIFYGHLNAPVGKMYQLLKVGISQNLSEICGEKINPIILNITERICKL
jgi:hypothetical protein